MAGHSKWANIRHKKGRQDAKRGKIFSRITKEIISAVKLGGTDPKTNTRLRLALQRAKAVNMPGENIQRNIKKASSGDSADYIEITYELYGHAGVGILCDIMTDNKNRVASEMRIAANKCGGSIASPGSVSFNFERKGIIGVLKKDVSEEDLFLVATEAGAEDFESDEESYFLTTDPSCLYGVKEDVEAAGFKVEDASVEMLAKSSIECSQESREKNETLLEWLENIDDVDNVYHNMS